MVASVKRQRLATPNSKTKTKVAPSPASQKKAAASSSISSFARVSKGGAGRSDVKKLVSKDVITTATASTTPAKESKLTAITPASRKRKAITTVPEEDSDESDAKETPTKETPRKAPVSAIESKTPRTVTSTPSKRGNGRTTRTIEKPRLTPTIRKRVRSPSLSDDDSVSRGADKLFKKLRLGSSPASTPSRSSTPQTASSFTTADSDVESEISLAAGPILPGDLVNFIDLFSSLLKSLSVHYAHNGINAVVDLRPLCRTITQAWGKRAATEDDIRICLAILNLRSKDSKMFSLINYGRGKTCLEADSTQVSGSLNEPKLKYIFRTNIESLWSTYTRKGQTDAIRFINSIEKAPVTVSASVAKVSPLLAKGQQRLEDLKKGIAAKKVEKETKAGAGPQEPAIDISKMSLLDRIRHKQMAKAALPPGLSAAELERRAALQRVADVAATVGMLSGATGVGRISFPMPIILDKLKDSFRMGISREEGAVCLRLLGKEIAPEWIRVVTLDQKENVVIEMDRQLSKVEIDRRVRAVVARQ